MADTIKIGGCPGLTAERRNGFPDGEQNFLKQIVAVVARSEAIADKYRIEPIVFNFEALQISNSEKLIPAEHHPFNSGARFSHFRKEAYPRQVITFHLPFSGEADLLKCQPSSWIMWSTDIAVSHGEIRFELINWQDETEQLKREQSEIIDRIRKQNENVVKDVGSFNSQLEEQARQAMSGRKAHLLKQSSIVESLGIPLRRAANVPQTFAVPAIPKKLVVKVSHIV